MANAPVPIPGATVAAADAAARANNALWYTFYGIGRAYLIRRGSDAALTADTTGVHGYSTIEQAYTNPNAVNAASQGAISQWNLDASLPAGGGVIGVVETVNITAPVAPGQAPTVSTQQNPTTAGLGSAFSLAFGNVKGLLTRTLKVIIGGVLMIAGVLKMSGTDKTLQQVVPLIGGPAGKVLRA